MEGRELEWMGGRSRGRGKGDGVKWSRDDHEGRWEREGVGRGVGGRGVKGSKGGGREGTGQRQGGDGGES